MHLEHALQLVSSVIAAARGPVSVFVSDERGDLIAAATMDGATPETRLHAQRKAYTAARSDMATTRELADSVRNDPVELASFDPFYCFFTGGVAIFDSGRKVGAMGVSGLSGDEDEELVSQALRESTAH